MVTVAETAVAPGQAHGETPKLAVRGLSIAYGATSYPGDTRVRRPLPTPPQPKMSPHSLPVVDRDQFLSHGGCRRDSTIGMFVMFRAKAPRPIVESAAR